MLSWYRPTSILASIAVRFHTLIFSDFHISLRSGNLQAARLSMNIRSIAMRQALDTLAQQSQITPTTLFRVPGSVSLGAGEEPFRVAIEELEELPLHDVDEDNHDLELNELCSSATATPRTSKINSIT